MVSFNFLSLRDNHWHSFKYFYFDVIYKRWRNIIKKKVGIIICIIFLFSTLPTATSTNPERIYNEPLSKTKDFSNNLPPDRYIFGIYIGTFVYNGIEYDNEYYWYSVTPINLRSFALIYANENYYFLNEPITEKPAYVNKDVFNHGFVGNHFMFIWGSSTF